MFKKILTATALLAVSVSTAFAAGEPWTKPAPSEMTAQHKQFAAQARRVQASLPAGQFGYAPLQVDWRFQGDRNLTLPLSNMSKAALNSAITGRYQVYSAVGQSSWSVTYYAPNGTTYFCENTGRGYKEFSMSRYVETTSFGLAGPMHWDTKRERTTTPPKNERVGWPTIANPSTGQFVTFSWLKGDWQPEQGWLQDDYAAAFAQNCPSLPRAGTVNNNQNGSTLQEISKGARAFRGFDVAFQNDPLNPLTAGMYYHLYPPAGR